MPVEVTYPHIVKEPARPARLERHPRTRVAMIVADYCVARMVCARNRTSSIPTYLNLAEVQAAMIYYFDHRQEIEDELVAEYRDVENWKKAHPTSPRRCASKSRPTANGCRPLRRVLI